MSENARRTAAVILICSAIAGYLGIAAARQAPGANETACLGNLRQVSTAMMMYLQDYDETLPPMKSMAGTQKLLSPYVRNSSAYTCPATKRTYKTNPVLNTKPLGSVAEPSKAVSFYDAAPHEDTQYSIAYVDGHVKREAKVPALAVKLIAKKAPSHIKKPRSRR